MNEWQTAISMNDTIVNHVLFQPLEPFKSYTVDQESFVVKKIRTLDDVRK